MIQKEAVGADMVLAVNHAATAARHRLAAFKASLPGRIGRGLTSLSQHREFVDGVANLGGAIASHAAMAPHVDKARELAATAIAEGVTREAKPHVEKLMTPESVSRMLREHIQEVSPMDLLFGSKKAFDEFIEKQALDPLSALAIGAAGHVGMNAINMAREHVNPKGMFGFISHKHQALNAAHHALAGKVVPAGRQELHGLIGGFENQAQNYHGVHAMTRQVMDHPAIGGDVEMAKRTMKAIASHPDFAHLEKTHPVFSNVGHAWRNLGDHTKMDFSHLVDHKPGDPGQAMKNTLKRTGMQAAVAGGALAMGEPGALVHFGWNKAREMVARNPVAGPLVSAHLVNRGVQHGRSSGAARLAQQLGMSPAVAHLQDAGAHVGAAMDKHLHPDMAKDIKHRVGHVLTDLDAMRDTGDWMVKNLGNIKPEQAAAAGGRFKHVVNALEPETRELVGRGAGAAYEKLKGFAAKHQGTINRGTNAVYQQAMKSVDESRGTPPGLREIGDDVYDRAIGRKVRALGVGAGVAAAGAGAALHHAQRGVSAVNKALDEDLAAHLPKEHAPTNWHEHAVPLAGAAAAGAGLGYMMNRKDDDQQKAAGEDGAVEAAHEVFGRAFEALLANPRANDPLYKQVREQQEKAAAEVTDGLPLLKAAFQTTVPVDLMDHLVRTPSVFPEDPRGHLLTMLHAAECGDEHALMILASLRGKEGTPEFNAAVNHLLASRRKA